MDNPKKLEALGKIRAGVPLSELVTQLGVPYMKLKKWKDEMSSAEDINTLANADEIIVHEMAERIRGEVMESGKEELLSEVDSAVKAIDTTQLLNTKMQTAGLLLANKITDMVREIDTAKDLNILVDSLSKLQTAFFSKNITTVNVLNDNSTNSQLSHFKSLLRS